MERADKSNYLELCIQKNYIFESIVEAQTFLTVQLIRELTTIHLY